MSGTRYQVEQTYENYVTGEKWTRILPRTYKTHSGAEARAQRNRYVTQPPGGTPVDSSTARVIEVPQ
jgi:hypothetical protein